MLKIWPLLLFTCGCIKLHAQTSYYNYTLDYQDQSNGLGSISLLNEDTLIIDGLIWDSFGTSKRSIHLINNSTGDSIVSYIFGKDNYLYGTGAAQNNIIKNDTIYIIGGALKNDSVFAAFHKLTLSGTLLVDSLFYTSNAYTRFDSFVQTDDGNLLVVGSKEVGINNLDLWLVKMDLDGNIIWEQTYGGVGIDGGFEISRYDSNSYLLIGYKDRDGANKSQIWLKKIDLIGSTIWEKYFGDIDYDGARTSVLSDSTVLIYGLLSTPLNANAHPFVMKLDQNGDEIWRYWHPNFPSIESEQNCYVGVIENNDQSTTLIGWKWDDLNNRTIGFLQKLSQNGDSIWYRELFVRNSENYLTDLKLLENGDIVMAGYVFPDSPENTEDGWIMRTNCLGYFEHPKDSIVFSGSGSNILSMTNYSSFFEYTIVDWGDNSSDTLHESGDQNLVHEYSVPGNYIINSTIIACNDTIQIPYEYLVTPEQYGTSDLVIFPNPNNGEFEIWLDSPELYSLEIIDMNGRIIKRNSEVSFNTGYPIDLSEFESSVYFVRAISGDKSFQKRVVIMN